MASVLLSSPVPLRLPVRAFARSSTSLCFHKFQHICPVPTVSPFRRGTKITPTTQHIKVSASACCRPALGRPPPQWSLNSATTTTATQPPPTTHTNTHTHTRATGNAIPPPPPPRLHKAGQAHLPHEFTVRPRSEGCRHADTQVSPQGGAGEPGLVKQAAQPHFLEARGVRIPGIQLFFFSFLHYTTEA